MGIQVVQFILRWAQNCYFTSSTQIKFIPSKLSSMKMSPHFSRRSILHFKGMLQWSTWLLKKNLWNTKFVTQNFKKDRSVSICPHKFERFFKKKLIPCRQMVFKTLKFCNRLCKNLITNLIKTIFIKCHSSLETKILCSIMHTFLKFFSWG